MGAIDHHPWAQVEAVDHRGELDAVVGLTDETLLIYIHTFLKTLFQKCRKTINGKVYIQELGNILTLLLGWFLAIPFLKVCFVALLQKCVTSQIG
jgi:hypothetical protein